MQLQMPHWFTLVVSAIGVCAGALVGQFPQYATLLGAIASVCALVAAPTIVKPQTEQVK